MNDDPWIVVRNWDKFQHYGKRNPPWIKNYFDLVHDDAYLSLSAVERALLHGLWLLYGAARRQLRRKTAAASLQLRVESKHWDALVNAGFIEFSASKPLALARARVLATEAEAETKEETEVVQPSVKPSSSSSFQDEDGFKAKTKGEMTIHERVQLERRL